MLQGWYRDRKKLLKSPPAAETAVLLFMLLGTVTLAITAFIAAPNTADSMTYHLSRVMHWMQNRSLDFYPTSIQRQLTFGPFAEMAMLDLQVLAGSDRLASFVQFLAMLGCVIGVSLIAKRLGATLHGQVFAALTAFSLPIGILEATSTQNDYVVTLWCVCFTAFVLTRIDRQKSSQLVMLSGAALGLAVLTKVTAVLYLTCIGAWFAVVLFRRLGVQAWRPLIVILAVSLIIEVPHALRNYNLYGNPLGIAPGPELGDYTNNSHGIRVLTSNVLRNTALQLATPWPRFNQGVVDLVDCAHDFLGIDINNRLSTWQGTHFQISFTLHEDSASNPLHLLLVVASLALLIHRRTTRTLIYALCLAGGFFLLCLVLKWQPWHSRLHLPLFILAMPVTAAIISAFMPGPRIYIPGFLLAIVSLPYLMVNSGRPLLGPDSILHTERLHQYFYYPTAPVDFTEYRAAAQLLQDSNCNRVGLVTHFDDREYLIWMIVRAYVPDAELEHILVKNASARYGTDFSPCAVFATTAQGGTGLEYQGHAYDKRMNTKGFRLFLLAGSPP